MHIVSRTPAPRHLAWALLALLAGPLVGLTAAGAASPDRSPPAVELSELVPSDGHRRATKVILDLMRRYHYRKVGIDDALSERVFERYLEALDPNRSIFLAADIAEFEPYRHKFDESLRYARLDPAFVIFKRFRRRMLERAERAVELVDEPFDFARDESYLFNREAAAWPADREELEEIWRRRVKNDVLELRLAGREDAEIADVLRKRYERMGRRVVQLNADDVYQFFVNAYTVSVEPHTAYFSPRVSENFKIRMSLSLEGIGAALQTENEYTVVRRIIAGGPAALSEQLHVNDKIIGVGQGAEAEIVDVVSWRLEDVVDLIRGPKNSVVRLQVLAGDAPAGAPPKTIALVRDKINLEERAAKRSVVEVALGGETVRIGVIDVPTFYLDSTARAQGLPDYRSTTRDVRRLVEELEGEGVSGIVVDLRGNSGGSLVEATELTGLFIASGPVVQIRDSGGRVQVNEDPDPSVAYSGPLAVLVDRRSASASEIFAAAIQDYRRGIIVGEPTFGKGTVQNLFDLDRRGGLGQLKVTIAQFFRVNGEGTQHRGVMPDVVFPTASDAGADGERSLDNALPWGSVRPAVYTPLPARSRVYQHARVRHQARVGRDSRFQLLLEEVASRREAREQTRVSLVEAQRRAEWSEREKVKDEREELYRKALGLGSADEDAGDDEADAAASPSERPDVPDILLEEAAQILADVVELTGRSRDAPAAKVADSGS